MQSGEGGWILKTDNPFRLLVCKAYAKFGGKLPVHHISTI